MLIFTRSHCTCAWHFLFARKFEFVCTRTILLLTPLIPSPCQKKHCAMWSLSLVRGAGSSNLRSLCGGRYRTACSALREQGRSKTGTASLPHIGLGTHECSRPCGRTIRTPGCCHLLFAGVGQRRRLFRVLDLLTVKWATGYLPEECQLLLDTHLMLLKKEQNPTTKSF